MPLKLSQMSDYLRACEDLVEMNVLHREPINLEAISGRTLEKVFDWMARHRNDEREQQEMMEVTCGRMLGPLASGFSCLWPNQRKSRWDEAFFGSMDGETLYRLREAAHLLGISKLRETVEKKIRRRFGKIQKVNFHKGTQKNSSADFSSVDFKSLIEEA